MKVYLEGVVDDFLFELLKFIDKGCLMINAEWTIWLLIIPVE